VVAPPFENSAKSSGAAVPDLEEVVEAKESSTSTTGAIRATEEEAEEKNMSAKLVVTRRMRLEG
jgi:hypothetical protein